MVELKVSILKGCNEAADFANKFDLSRYCDAK